MHAVICEIGFCYDDDPKQIKQVLKDLALVTEGILKQPEPNVYTLSYGDFAINYGVRIFIDDYQSLVAVRDRYMTQLWEVAKAEGLTIPFPTQEIFLRK